MTTIKPILFFTLAATLAASVLAGSKDAPFAPVERAVKERTGLTVRWQQNAEARDESLRMVRALLKKPLSVNSAVQIALLNSLELQAASEDVGVSAADLREAGTWKNPRPESDFARSSPFTPSRGTCGKMEEGFSPAGLNPKISEAQPA